MKRDMKNNVCVSVCLSVCLPAEPVFLCDEDTTTTTTTALEGSDYGFSGRWRFFSPREAPHPRTSEQNLGISLRIQFFRSCSLGIQLYFTFFIRISVVPLFFFWNPIVPHILHQDFSCTAQFSLGFQLCRTFFSRISVVPHMFGSREARARCS